MVTTRSKSMMEKTSVVADTSKQTRKGKMKMTTNKEDDREKSTKNKGRWYPMTIDYEAFKKYVEKYIYVIEENSGDGSSGALSPPKVKWRKMSKEEVYNAHMEWLNLSQNEKDKYIKMVKEEKARKQELREKALRGES